MNILMLRTNSCAPDPRVEKEVNSLISREQYRVNIVCWDRDGRKGSFYEFLSLPNGDVPVLRFGIPASWGGGMKANLLPVFKFEWKIFLWLMTHAKRYDTVHACDLLTGLPALLPCLLFRKKLVYDIFDYYAATQTGPKWLLDLFRRLENGVISFADATIICSEQRKKQIEPSRPKKLTVLHNAPPESLLETDSEKSLILQGDGKRIRIVYVGNLVEDRFVMKALECAGRLPEVEFHIGGFGVLEDKIRRLAAGSDNIYFYGRLSYRDVLALERQCHIMLALYDPAVPNHAYAAPNKFYEALALGKPLVMFRGTGMADIVEDEDLGVVCEATEQSLFDGFCRLLQRRDRWDGMGERMRLLFREAYRWEIMEQRLLELYDELT